MNDQQCKQAQPGVPSDNTCPLGIQQDPVEQTKP